MANCFDENNVNSAIEVYFQLGAASIQLNPYAELLASIIGEQFFNQLRTQEQLGRKTL